jgi:methylene-tetrahydromethanopterin dehydrogenase
MSKKHILHLLFPGENVSPFDVNMAVDAGFEVIVPYTGLGAERVQALVQDAIFSRPPRSFAETGVFIGGYDVNLAAEMLERARGAMVPPFELSVFADPNGAYTTSAALVALLEHWLEKRTAKRLQGRKVMIFGGGPVGLCTAVLVAKQGGIPALVRLIHRRQDDSVTRFAERYEVEIGSIDGQEQAQRLAALEAADIAVAAAKAGIRVIDQGLLDQAPGLLVAADVNAVPPSGIEGVGATDNGVELETAAGKVTAIGALAIGKVKYAVQQGLFRQMIESDRALVLDFPDAFRLAAQHV